MNGISIATCFDYSIPITQQFELIQKACFSHVSLGGNYDHSRLLTIGGQRDIQELSKETGLQIDTIHGYAMDKNDTIEVNTKLANVAMILNVPVIVLHCSSFTFNPASFEDRKKDIMNKLPAFEELSKNTGVKFAFENVLPGVATELMKYILSNSNPEYFGFCYDSSHDQIDGPNPLDLLCDFSNRLFSVHISDRIKELVDHVTPGEGFIDFCGIGQILKPIDCNFPLLMEVMITHSKYKKPKEFLAITYTKANEILQQEVQYGHYHQRNAIG